MNITVGSDLMQMGICAFYNGPAAYREEVMLQCPKHTRGRFLKLQIIAGTDNFLNLCEVEVYGKKSLGKIENVQSSLL